MVDVLKVENLSVRFNVPAGAVEALRNVSLTIRESEVVGLVGESGSGKSTMALAIMRYLGSNGMIVSGKILLKGENLAEKSEKEMRRIRGKKVALVYQNPETSLNPSLKIGEQITEAIRLHEGLGRKEAWEKAEALLDKINIPNPDHIMRLYPHQLSGGQQQRVVIGMALSCNPDLLILDEPTTALDVTTQAKILDLLEELRTDLKLAMLYITHDLGVIVKIADKINVLYAGTIVEKGFTRQTFKHPLHPYTYALLNCIPRPQFVGRKLQFIKGSLPNLIDISKGCIFYPRCGIGTDECCNRDIDLREIYENHESACIRTAFIQRLRTEEKTEEFERGVKNGKEIGKGVVLSIVNVKAYYGKKSLIHILIRRSPPQVKAVDGVDLEVEKGETLGIIGESGCGKTTLGESIVQLRKVTSGKIWFKGKDIFNLSDADLKEYRKNVSIVFQNPDSSLNPKKRIRDILRRPLELFNVVPAGAKRELKVAELLEVVGLRDEYAERFPHELSGGEKQRVAIARAISTQPEILICDEPTSFLDVSVQASIINLLTELKKEMEMACIFITHNLSLAEHISDRMAVMYLGKVVEIGSREQIFSPPFHPYTEALLSSIPVPDPDHKAESIRLEGSVPSAKEPPTGCRFHTRCPRRMENLCEMKEPIFLELQGGHKILCHLPLNELRVPLNASGQVEVRTKEV